MCWRACSRVQVADEEKALDADNASQNPGKIYEAWSAQGYRVLGVAVKPVSAQPNLSRVKMKPAWFSPDFCYSSTRPKRAFRKPFKRWLNWAFS